MRVKLENQVLIELYKEQIVMNGLKVPVMTIPQNHVLPMLRKKSMNRLLAPAKAKEKLNQGMM